MSILEKYKKDVESHQRQLNSSVDSITFYILMSKTKDITDKETILEYLYNLEKVKMKELLEYSLSFNLRKPYSLERELTTIKFLIASIEM